MRIDPAAVLHSYITGLAEFADVMVSVSMIGRTKGMPSIVLDPTGGYCVVRHRADRAEFTINSYDSAVASSAARAFALRDHLLEDLPGRVAGGALVLDVVEVHMPFFLPDMTSGEFRHVHSIAVYLTEASL
ncbi:hypothetical protein ACFU99_00705 [Streptomyces sp. NPDC057654]|uniref:hypothetical protein n=1 Tax=Streptomyces sp. NPDC057654 TaxID=3346196 RepID=UPI0036A3B771